MLRRTFLLLSIPVSFLYLKAQDISVVSNTVDVYSNNLNTGTARYNAMGGAMGALGGDISSINVNPAGLGVYIANDLNLTLGINSNKNTTSLAGKSLNYTINKVDMDHVGAVMAFNLSETSKWKFVNIGVNYTYQSIENYSEAPGNDNIKIVDDFSFLDPITYTYKGHAYNRYGDVSKVNFAVGANYDNRIYWGLGLNFHEAYINQYDSAVFHSSYDDTTLVYDKQYTNFDERSNGFSANIGVIAKLDNAFRIGASIETPTWWNIDRVYNQYYFGKNTVNVYGEDRFLSTPMKASISAAFVPNKNFSINVDYIQGLTKPKYKEYGAAEAELNDFFSENYKHSSEIRVGTEYRLDNFRLRAGYAYQSNPFNTTSVLAYNDAGSQVNTSYSNFILGSRSTLGLGIGYDFRAFYLDVAYQNITSEYKSPFLYGNVNYDSGYFNQGFDVNSNAYAVSNVKNTRNNFAITLGWRF